MDSLANPHPPRRRPRRPPRPGRQIPRLAAPGRTGRGRPGRTHGHRHLPPPSPGTHRSRLLRSAPALASRAYHVDCSEKLVLDRLSRYESRIQPEYSRCLKDLHTLLRKKLLVETNPKSKVNPVHPRPSDDSDAPGESATAGHQPSPNCPQSISPKIEHR